MTVLRTVQSWLMLMVPIIIIMMMVRGGITKFNPLRARARVSRSVKLKTTRKDPRSFWGVTS